MNNCGVTLEARVAAALAASPTPGRLGSDPDLIAEQIFELRQAACAEVLGRQPKIYDRWQPSWFNANRRLATTIFDTKHEMYLKYTRGEITDQQWNECRNKCNKQIKLIKEEYWLNKAQTLIELFERGDMRAY